MPELPGVAVFKRYFDTTALHQEISDVAVNDRQVLAEIGPETLTSRLNDRSFESTHRHGKYLFVQVDEDGELVLHFGMTGHLAYFKDPADEPQHTQILWSFANDYHSTINEPAKPSGHPSFWN